MHGTAPSFHSLFLFPPPLLHKNKRVLSWPRKIVNQQDQLLTLSHSFSTVDPLHQSHRATLFRKPRFTFKTLPENFKISSLFHLLFWTRTLPKKWLFQSHRRSYNTTLRPASGRWSPATTVPPQPSINNSMIIKCFHASFWIFSFLPLQMSSIRLQFLNHTNFSSNIGQLLINQTIFSSNICCGMSKAFCRAGEAAKSSSIDRSIDWLIDWLIAIDQPYYFFLQYWSAIDQPCWIFLQYWSAVDQPCWIL